MAHSPLFRPLVPVAAVVLALSGCGSEYSPEQLERIVSTSQVTFDAGVVAVGERETLDIYLQSSGKGEVTVFDVSVDDPEHWEVVEDWHDGGGSLTIPGGSATDPIPSLVQVRFKPDAVGAFRTVMTVTSDDNQVTETDEDGSGLWRVVLRGLAREPCAAVHPAFHDFGPRPAGGYFSQEVTIENCGVVVLEVTAYQLEGDPVFSVQTPPQAILPGDSTTIAVAFQPDGARAPAHGELHFVSNAPALDAVAVELVGNDCTESVDPAWDGDGDGWTSCGGDCDDTDPAVSPSGSDSDIDGDDDDCDGDTTDGPNPSSTDDDGDGFSEAAGDCDDADELVHPDAEEVVNQLDDDCDGRIDEGSDRSDDDGDGWSEREGDCDDTDDLVYPGAEEQQHTDLEVDDDCDGLVDEGGTTFDDDGDGHAEYDATGTEADCDDEDPWTFPGAAEDCDGRDNDCDGAVDEGEDDTPDGACAFLVEREEALEAEQQDEGCSAVGGAAGGVLALVGLVAVGRRREG